MRVFLALLILFGSYMYMLLHTANVALAQTQQLSHLYQHVSSYSDQVAAGTAR